ncbi:helix-turn-helix domain-containing protein [Patulibacter sp. NPDC049589]|uniref:helix-turn-helix domain-containing protein n=1 Tax=Patulibacter sp. NPDC049589 TaxID=3154731 RepID=UPI003427623D
MEIRAPDPAELHPSIDLARACGPITDAARTFAAGLDVEAMATQVAEELIAIVHPQRVGDAPFRDAVRKSAADSLDVIVRIVLGRNELDRAAGIGPSVLADALAEVGASPSQFERTYRLGVPIVCAAWYREAVAFARATSTALEELVGAPTMVINAYLDAVVSPLLEPYSMPGDGRATSDQIRHLAVRQVLDGAVDLSASDVAHTLGVTPEHEHVAFVVQGSERERAAAVRLARREVDAAGAVTHRHGLESWLVWLSARDGFEGARLRGLHEALEGSGLPVAIGTAQAGAAGFAATGREAVETARLQALLGDDARPLLAHADVRLEVLFLDLPDRARAFVRQELGPLGDAGPRCRDQRETALAWLTTGSHVATAARLGIHEHTARNRILQIEELLGHRLTSRRAELLAALRLHRVLVHQAPD